MAKRKLQDDPATEADESLIDDPTDTTEVDEKAVMVADAKAKLDEAQAELTAAQNEHEAAVVAAMPKAERGKHVLVDMGGAGVYSIVDAPEGYNADAPDYRILLNGKNLEHVDTINGIWAYRAM